MKGRIGNWVLNHFKKHIIRYATISGLTVSWIGIHGRLIVEPVAVLIEKVPIVAVMETEREHAQLWQGVKLLWLRDSIVVDVDLQPQLGIDGIAPVNNAIAIAAVF